MFVHCNGLLPGSVIPGGNRKTENKGMVCGGTLINAFVN